MTHDPLSRSALAASLQPRTPSRKHSSLPQNYRELFCAILDCAQQDLKYLCRRGFIAEGRVQPFLQTHEATAANKYTRADAEVLLDFFTKGAADTLLGALGFELDSARILRACGAYQPLPAAPASEQPGANPWTSAARRAA